MSDPNARHQSFGQRIGVEDLPQQLKRDEISAELSSLLWAITHDSIEDHRESDYGYSGIKEPWHSILKSYFILKTHGDLDNFSKDPRWLLNFVKSHIFRTDYLKTLNFIDFVISSKRCPRAYRDAVASALEYTHAAYRVSGEQIVPVGSDESAKAIVQALASVDGHPAKGPSTHLRAAARELTDGNWASAIRESIHSIEAAAKIIEPTAQTLGPALSKLEARGEINGAQKRAFGALYGYTSDTNGVRHALTFDDTADVSEKDAMFMFGACAAFASFLLTA
jgi:hypothetical protein